MTNVKATDLLILQRKTAQTDRSEYIKAPASDLLTFNLSEFDDILDSYSTRLDQEIVDRTEGDIVLHNDITAFAERVRLTAEAVFPVVSNNFYRFRIDLPTQSTFNYDYNACIRGLDNSDPVIDPSDPDLAQECYDKHALKMYEELLTNPSIAKETNFYVLAHDSAQAFKGVTHLFISDVALNTPTVDTIGDDVVNWETEVGEGDFIQISLATTQGLVVDNKNYGIYKVKSLRTDANPDVNGAPFSMVEVEYIGGPHVFLNPAAAYQVKVMKSLDETLGAEYVNKTGDDMSGPLLIDAVTPNNYTTFTNLGGMLTKDIDIGAVDHSPTINIIGESSTAATVNVTDSALLLRFDGDNQFRLNAAGGVFWNPLQYYTAPTLSDNKELTHKGYVDTADAVLDLRIDQVNTRIDTISDLIESQKYVAYKTINCWDDTNLQSQAQWIACINNQIAINTDLPATQAVYFRPNQTLKDPNTGNESDMKLDMVTAFMVSQFSLEGVALYDVKDGDIVEFELDLSNAPVGTPPQIVRYVAGALDINVSEDASEEVEVQSEKFFYINVKGLSSFMGSDEFLYEESYKIKHFPANQGISVSDGDDRYVLKQGFSTIKGRLDIRAQNDTEMVFSCGVDGESNNLQVVGSGETTHFGVPSVYLSATDDDDTDSIRVFNKGIDAANRIIFSIGSDPKLTIAGVTTNFGGNRIEGIQTPASTSVPGTGIDTEYFRSNLHTFIQAGFGINIIENDKTPEGYSQGITITAPPSDSSFSSLSDVAQVGTPQDGDIVSFDSSIGKWTVGSLDSVTKGKDVFANSESAAEVGGLWRQGDNFFIRVE